MAVFNDVACTVCGCVCDDLRLTIENGRIVRAEGACPLSEGWLLGQDSRQPPVAEIDGQSADLEAAIERSAEILAEARWPLIFGLSRSSTEGQRAAIRLADQIRANIDTTASLCHAPSVMAIQEVGESTCTLGEIKNRADLVIFWGVDPVRSHPRHFQRYSVDPAGMFVPHGRKDRTVVVIDAEPSESSRLADLFIPVERGRDFEALWSLRCLVKGLPLPPRCDVGVSLESLSELSDRMKSCRCGVVFFGLGLARLPVGHRNVEALLRLVADLNAYTRFHARRMRIPGDVTGADMALCWQTGFPFAVNLSRGYPRLQPWRILGQRDAGTRRGRCVSLGRQRGRLANVAAGPVATPSHSDHCVGPSHRRLGIPASRPFHHGRLRHPPAGNGLSHGRSAYFPPSRPARELPQRCRCVDPHS